MDNAANNNSVPGDPDKWDLDEWLEFSSAEEKAKRIRQAKKRRKPMRKNRKPSRPTSYIGQRSNNHLLRIFSDLPITHPTND